MRRRRVSRILPVALQELDRDALRSADEADTHAGPGCRRFFRELDALGLDLGGDRVDVLYRQSDMVEPLVGRHRRRVDAVTRFDRRDEHLGAAELDVDAPGSADDLATQDIPQPRGGRFGIGTAQMDVVPGDDGHRDLLVILGVAYACNNYAPNLTAGFLQFHPWRTLVAILPSRNETIVDVSDCVGSGAPVQRQSSLRPDGTTPRARQCGWAKSHWGPSAPGWRYRCSSSPDLLPG